MKIQQIKTSNKSITSVQVCFANLKNSKKQKPVLSLISIKTTIPSVRKIITINYLNH